MKRICTLLALIAIVPLVPTTAEAAWSRTCMGYEADVVGTNAAESFGASESRDRNNDGVVAIVGRGGNDAFYNSVDSGTFVHVFFCGGDGKDQAFGWFRGFNGQSGKDKAVVTDCRLKGYTPILKSVETKTTSPCDAP